MQAGGRREVTGTVSWDALKNPCSKIESLILGDNLLGKLIRL